MSRETCMIFVDDSNVWIEAQKVAASGNSHMPKLKDGELDSRLRIDIGKLVERLRRGRIQGPSFLYGSRPPPNDSVWKAFEKNKFETNIYNRNSEGKEKEVDNSMSADMTVKATELRVLAERGDFKAREERDNTTFVVITGDRDMLPVVKKILLKCGIRVELWAWKSGISNEYLNLQSELGGDLFSVRLLDSIFKDISFTAFRSTRKNKTVVGGKTIVVCDINQGEERAISSGQRDLTGETDLCIEFPRVDQIEKVILEARQLLPGTTILSWPEYRARFNKGPKDGETIRSSNIYELLEEPPTSGLNTVTRTGEKDETQLEAAGPGRKAGNTTSTSVATILDELQDMILKKEKTAENDNSNNGEGWNTVANKSDPGKRHRRIINQKQDCPYGLSCKKREDCSYRHTDAEQRIFRRNPNPQTSNLYLHKTKMCHYAGYCTRGRDCNFAHSEAEGRCLDCKQTGHFQGDVGKCPLQR